MKVLPFTTVTKVKQLSNTIKCATMVFDVSDKEMVFHYKEFVVK